LAKLDTFLVNGEEKKWREEMIKNFMKQFMSAALSFLLVIAAAATEGGPLSRSHSGGYFRAKGVPLSAEELQTTGGPHRTLPGLTSCAGSWSGDLSRPGRYRCWLASATQLPYG